ncbi:MAG: hypothetical protein ABJC04_08890, partial [Verrucomicrobiota bacterium]
MNSTKKFNLFAIALLVGVAAIFFYQSFAPDLVLRANDLPVAATKAKYYNDIGSMAGLWDNLHWVGISNGARPIALTTFSLFLLGSIGQAKFAGMIALILVGLSGFWCFSRMKFTPTISLFGAVALMLNMLFFSFSAWGVYLWNFALFFLVLALGLIYQRKYTVKHIVGIGICAGMCVNEGIDVGAIFAIVIGIYFIYCNWTLSVKNIFRPALQLIAIVILALLVSSNWAASLIQTNIQGVAKEKATAQEEQEKWAFMTQWSLPKKEAATLLVPGLFGYRMDTRDGGNYWGEIGQDRPGTRYTGSGQYTGKAVLLLALIASLWALLPLSKRGDGSAIPFQRREIIFWLIIGLVFLSISFGKHFFTYGLIYPLPFFNSMRNPVKFLPVVMMALVVLSAHGLQLLYQRWDSAKDKLLGKIVFISSAVLLILNVILLIGWANGRSKLFAYLNKNGFSSEVAQAVFRFSQQEIQLSLVFLILTTVAIFFYFRGRNKTVAITLLGLILLADLGYADGYWKDYYNYRERYKSNPVLDYLQKSPEPWRVAGPRGGSGPYYLLALQDPQSEQWQQFIQGISSLYDVEWLQHLFLYYNIPSSDIIQWPRMPIMDRKFASAFAPRVIPPGSVSLGLQPRFWQLTSTRYLLASPTAAQALNNSFGAPYHFSVAKTFGIGREQNYYTAVETADGPLAVLDFTNALPRAVFYSQWQTETNEDKALQILTTKEFDPAKEVVVAEEIPGFKSAPTNAFSEVHLTSHSHKKTVISATNALPGILLINSKYDTNWRITVDGQPKPLLRCNFLMSGV